ncbi:hypothetical protein HDU96_000668 [Phlyctochytrium bullatum]|nr:hypothetical protein HDU96_000668 [Phlyctochytrium bullatum]
MRKTLKTWTTSDVRTWLRTLPFNTRLIEAAENAFAENDVDGEVLTEVVTLESLLEDLNLQSFGLRCKLWDAISKLKESPPSDGAVTLQIEAAPASFPGGSARSSTSKVPVLELGKNAKRIDDMSICMEACNGVQLSQPEDFSLRRRVRDPCIQRIVQRKLRRRLIRDTLIFPDLSDDSFKPPMKDRLLAVWICPTHPAVESPRTPVRVFIKQGNSVEDFIDNSGSYIPPSMKRVVVEQAPQMEQEEEEEDEEDEYLNEVEDIYTSEEEVDEEAEGVGETGRLADDGPIVGPVSDGDRETLGDHLQSIRGPEETKKRKAGEMEKGNLEIVYPEGPVQHVSPDTMELDSSPEEMATSPAPQPPQPSGTPPVEDPTPVDTMIAEQIKAQRLLWEEKYLPRWKDKAHVVYRWRACLPKWTKELTRCLEVRMPRLVEAIKESWGARMKPEHMRLACESLRETVYLIEELQFKILVAQKDPPERVVKPQTEKRVVKKPRIEEGEEEEEEDEMAEFIVPDSEFDIRRRGKRGAAAKKESRRPQRSCLDAPEGSASRMPKPGRSGDVRVQLPEHPAQSNSADVVTDSPSDESALTESESGGGDTSPRPSHESDDPIEVPSHSEEDDDDDDTPLSATQGAPARTRTRYARPLSQADKLRRAREAQERMIRERAKKYFLGSLSVLTFGSYVQVKDEDGGVIEGIQFMWRTLIMVKQVDEEANTESYAGSILAHEMGLGKTLQTIVIEKRALIVVPAMILDNWEREFIHWIPQPMRDVVLNQIYVLRTYSDRAYDLEAWMLRGGIMIASYDTIRELLKTRPQLPEQPEAAAGEGTEVVVGSVEPSQIEKVRSLAKKAMQDFPPAILVCDEAHKIKSDKSVNIEVLSSIKTPSRLCLTGSPLQNDLGEYFHMVNFVVPGFLGTFETFKAEYISVIKDGQNYDSSPQDKKRAKNQLYVLANLLSPIIARKDAKEILVNELPGKTEFLIMVRPTMFQIALYEPCYVGVHIDWEDPSLSAKVGVVAEIVKEAKQYLQKILSEMGAKCSLITGKSSSSGGPNSKSRQQTIDQFNSHSSTDNVLLLTTGTGAVGINLCGASRVIIVDVDWNPTHDEQSIARSYRMGQKRHVFVYRLVTSGTAEEIVFKRNLSKMDLASKVIDHKGTKNVFLKKELVWKYEKVKIYAPQLDKTKDYGDPILRAVIDA